MFYLINKPPGISSFKAIADFAREHHIAKIGHAGTLDPLASGALLVATNGDTKLLSYVSNTTKTYVVTLQVGCTSSTYDQEGRITQVSSQVVSLPQFKQVARTFQGRMQQVPPAFSAKKIRGQRAYDLARRGLAVHLQPVPVKIFKMSNFRKRGANQFAFHVKVSSGTYIRSLVHDMGTKLKTGAIMTQLKRIKMGALSLHPAPRTINPLHIIKLKQIKLKDVQDLLHGKVIKINKGDGSYLLMFQDEIIGIGIVQNRVLQSQKILGLKLQKAL